MTSKRSIKSALESMMFTWGEPLPVKDAADVLNMPAKEIYDAFAELASEYEEEGRGIRIREVNKAFQFITYEGNSEYIERLCTPVKTKRLSQSALEVLAIIAYKQPVTRAEIESIRGIKCERVIEGLSRKGLIREAGRSQGIGRPILYATTDLFLANFGFKDLSELPDIDDIGGAISDVDAQDAIGGTSAESELEAQQFTIDLTGSGIGGPESN